MKNRILLIIGLFFICLSVHSQDTIRIKHINYVTVFSKSLKYPVLVEWWDTKSKDECPSKLPRSDKFQPDPYLKRYTDLESSYKGQHIDRGHMCPAASNECSGEEVLIECFYFSNMAPQYHSLNAGDFKSVEVYTRNLAEKYDSVHVWAGSIGVAKVIGQVSVPTKCWKVIHIKKTNEWFGFLFNNTPDKPTGIDSHRVDVSEITKLTGFKFN
jgi:endonuclease G